MIRAHKLTARPLTARKLIAYKLGQGPVSGFDPLRLFSAGEDGTWLDFTTTQVYADTAGTDPAEVGEGIAFVDDKSPNDTDATQSTSTARPIFARVPRGGRRNLLTYTEELDNAVWFKDGATISGTKLIESATNAGHLVRQSDSSGLLAGVYTAFFDVSPDERDLCEVWVGRAPLTAGAGARFNLTTGEVVSSRGAGGNSVTATAITNLGGGVYRCAVTVNYVTALAPTAYIILIKEGVSTSSLTYLGDGTSGINVFKSQLELASEQSAYQKVVTQHDVTEAGIPSIYNAFFDKSDDILPITLPAITGGTIILFGTLGYYIESLTYAGGTFNIGATTYTGGAAGVIALLGGVTAVLITDRALTTAERASVIAWGVARGSIDADLNP